MNRKITRLEESAMNAFPALSTEMYDGWILRFSNGYTYRGNCINPIYSSSINLEEKISYCESKFSQKSLPCVFKMFDGVEDDLDRLLESKGYNIKKSADIMYMPLQNFAFTELNEVTIEYSMNKSWLDNFVILNGTEEEPMKSTAKAMLSNIQNPVLCASIYENGEMAACGLGVLEDGQVGLYDIRVLEKYRRKGFGTKICKQIIQESINLGTHSAYLQVATTNDIAIQMYKNIAFEKLYTYWYRVKNL